MFVFDILNLSGQFFLNYLLFNNKIYNKTLLGIVSKCNKVYNENSLGIISKYIYYFLLILYYLLFIYFLLKDSFKA